MKSISKIVIFAVLFAFSAGNCYPQSGSTGIDSVQNKKKNETNAKSGQENQNQNQDKNQNQVKAKGDGAMNLEDNAKDQSGTRNVKQVNGAKPDMSKARGARPPSIGRPSGSGIPRGIGKPGGAMKHGGR